MGTVVARNVLLAGVLGTGGGGVATILLGLCTLFDGVGVVGEDGGGEGGGGSTGEDAEGSIGEDAEGSIGEDAEGSTGEDVEGSIGEDAEGGIGEDAAGVGDEHGTVSKEAAVSTSVSTDGEGFEICIIEDTFVAAIGTERSTFVAMAK